MLLHILDEVLLNDPHQSRCELINKTTMLANHVDNVVGIHRILLKLCYKEANQLDFDFQCVWILDFF